jgi:hypothetical protein
MGFAYDRIVGGEHVGGPDANEKRMAEDDPRIDRPGRACLQMRAEGVGLEPAKKATKSSDDCR